MSVGQASGEGKGEFQILNVAPVDLIKRAVACAGVIFCRPHPLPVIRLQLSCIGANLVIGFRLRQEHAGSIASGVSRKG